jgi:phosphoglycolate phosphatase
MEGHRVAINPRETQRKIKLVLFDFDGTIADSYQGITASINHLRAKYGMRPLTVNDVRPHVGGGAPRLLQRTVPGGTLPEDLAEYRLHHETVMRAGTRLYPEVERTLTVLKSAGVCLGVCSNKPAFVTRQLLDYLEVRSIDTLVGPDEQTQRKPAPDMLLRAMRTLDVCPADTIFVGDTVIDIETARNAGVKCWVVTTGSDTRHDLIQARPECVLENLSELIGPILSIASATVPGAG